MSEFLQEFSLQATRFFSPDPQAQTEANKFFTLLVNTVNNPDMLISVLYTTECPKILYILNIVLYEMMGRKWSIFSVAHKVSIYTFSIKSLATNWSSFTDKRLIDYTVRLIIRIAKHSWNEDLEFSKLPQYCEEFLMQKREVMMIGLKIIQCLLVEMGPDSENQAMKHLRNSEMFRDWIVPVLFSQVYRCLKQNNYFLCQDFEAIQLCSQIFSIVLDFGKKNSQKNFDLPLSESAHWNGLRDEEVIEKLALVFYENSECRKFIIRFWGNLIRLPEKFFWFNETKFGVVEKVSNKVLEVLNRSLPLGNGEVLNEFVYLLDKMVKNMEAVHLIRENGFERFLERMFLTTKDVICASLHEGIVYNCLRFWNSVSRTERSEGMEKVLFEVCKVYIEFVISNEELQIGDSMLSNTSSILAGISKHCQNHLFPLTIQLFQHLANHLPKSSTQLSQLIHIASVLISDSRRQFLSTENKQKKFKVSTQSCSPDFYSQVSDLSYLVFLLSSHLVSLNSSNPDLESSCIDFFSVFCKIYINSSSEISLSLLRSLSTKLAFEHVDSLLVQIISFVFSFSSSSNLQLYNKCMNLFSDLAGFSKNLRINGQDVVFCGCLQFLKENVEEIIEKWTAGELGFISNNLPCKARTVFVSSMFRLFYLIRSASVRSFADMMKPLQNLVDELGDSPEKAACFCCDLLGVCQSASNSEQFSEIFNWISQRSEVLLKVFEILRVSGEGLFPLLKFLQELSFNRMERLRFLGDSLINTHILKFCMKITCLFLINFDPSKVSSNVYQEIYKPLSACVHIFKNTLTGEYMNTKEITNDQTIFYSIKLLLQKVLEIPAENITSSIKIFSVLYEVIFFISNNQILIKSIIYSLNSTEVSSLFEILIEGCQSLIQFICQLSYFIIKNLVHDCIFKNSPETSLFCKDNSESFKRLMRVLLVVVFGGEGKNFSLISYPLLGLINLYKEEYLNMLPGLYLIQGPERAEL